MAPTAVRRKELRKRLNLEEGLQLREVASGKASLKNRVRQGRVPLLVCKTKLLTTSLGQQSGQGQEIKHQVEPGKKSVSLKERILPWRVLLTIKEKRDLEEFGSKPV